jgi:hypothetical protein
LPIAPSTYHAHIAQRIDPSKRSARAQRDAELKIEVQRVFAENATSSCPSGARPWVRRASAVWLPASA